MCGVAGDKGKFQGSRDFGDAGQAEERGSRRPALHAKNRRRSGIRHDTDVGVTGLSGFRAPNATARSQSVAGRLEESGLRALNKTLRAKLSEPFHTRGRTADLRFAVTLRSPGPARMDGWPAVVVAARWIGRGSAGLPQGTVGRS